MSHPCRMTFLTISTNICLFLSTVVGQTPTSERKLEAKLPSRIVDPHHHFLDTGQNKFSSFLGLVSGNMTYYPEDYDRDVKFPLQAANVKLSGTVHIEAFPDTPFGGVEESKWVQSLVDGGQSDVKAIVGSCDLGDEDNIEECLALLNVSSPIVRGVRWMLDLRNDTDYLRGGENGTVVPAFEKGYASLAKYNMSFDLQCAPAQLLAAADMISRHPNIPVVIDHLGKPRLLLGADSNNEEPDKDALKEWREGMQAMANLPHVYVKISMLGYIVPDWILSPARGKVIRDVALDTVKMFGPERCMIATNWWLNPSRSDNDGLGTVGPSALGLVRNMSTWFQDFSDEEKDWMFAKTAEKFYRISSPV